MCVCVYVLVSVCVYVGTLIGCANNTQQSNTHRQTHSNVTGLPIHLNTHRHTKKATRHKHDDTHTQICIHAHTRAHTHLHAHTHTYTYTYTHRALELILRLPHLRKEIQELKRDSECVCARADLEREMGRGRVSGRVGEVRRDAIGVRELEKAIDKVRTRGRGRGRGRGAGRRGKTASMVKRRLA